MAYYMLFDVDKGWILDILRKLFAFFDLIIYSFISFLFKAVFNLANFELVGFYEVLEQRVYVILGIFMLFKVTISMISYLVNPDKLNDKEQGVGKLVTRVIMVLIMLIALPTFFNLLTEAQNKLLPVIPRIVIGTTTTLDGEDAHSIANSMSVTMLQGFAHVKDGCVGNPVGSPSDFFDHINDSCNDSDRKDIYKYDYLPIVSTITGAIMCYVIFSLSISVAIRAFKLIILRMLAPVPVISYIDPKSSKDGMFTAWRKTLISTWSELFIHIGLIYFIVYIIDFLVSGAAYQKFFDGVAGIDAVILLAFLIIGLLMFAKSAPKFIFDALGIKNTGSFTKMLGLGATALSAGGNIASGYKARNEYDAINEKGSHKLRNLGASLFGGMAATATAGNALLSGKDSKITAGVDQMAKSTAQGLNRINSGSTATGRLTSALLGMTTGQTPADKMRKRSKELEDAAKAFKDYKSTIESRFDGNDEFIMEYEGSRFNWLNFEKNFNAANNGDESALNWLMSIGFTTTVSVPEEYDETYTEDVQVRVDDEGVMPDGNGNMVPAYHYETKTVTKTRKATRMVTKNVADLNKIRASYEDIHKKGYTQFEDAVVQGTKDENGKLLAEDSVIIEKLRETKDVVKGIVVDEYDKAGNKTGNTVNLSSFNGGYSTTKGNIGNATGTRGEYVRDPDYKAAMADDNENKKKN